MQNRVIQPTATSLNKAMKVFRDQQKVLQENAKALLEQDVPTPADLQERRAK